MYLKTKMSNLDSLNTEYRNDTLRREITQVTQTFALCFCTFVTTTIIENFIFEKVSLSKLSSSLSSTSSSSGSSGSTNSTKSTDSLELKNSDHESIKKKVKLMLWSRTNSSVSMPFEIGTILEAGDYTIGVSFENEIDAKELYSITFFVKYKSISNFFLSQMLTQLFRTLGYAPSQLLQLSNKSEGEVISNNQKIRNDLSKVLKSIETLHNSNNSNNSSLSIGSSVPLGQTVPVLGPVVSATTEIKSLTIPGIEEIKLKLNKIDDKCNETTYLLKEQDTKLLTTNLTKEQDTKFLTTELSKEVTQLKQELLKSNEELLTKFKVIEGKLKCFSEDIPVVTVSDIISITRERNTLLTKLTEAENLIDELQTKESGNK